MTSDLKREKEYGWKMKCDGMNYQTMFTFITSNIKSLATTSHKVIDTEGQQLVLTKMKSLVLKEKRNKENTRSEGVHAEKHQPVLKNRESRFILSSSSVIK